MVTGTLEGGTLAADQRVEILPGETTARIRGLETHKETRELAVPGARVALNLQGVEPDQVARGHAVVVPGRYRLTDRFNAWVRLLESPGVPLKDLGRLLLYVGSAERNVRIRTLDAPELAPGQEGVIQVEVEGSLPLQWGDRFILRDPGVPATVGGGRVLEPFARRIRGRRLRLGPSHAAWRGVRRGGSGDPEHLSVTWLRSLAGTKLRGLLGSFLEAYQVIRRSELPVLIPLARHSLEESVAALESEGVGVVLPSYVLSQGYWRWAAGEVRARLESFHRRYPLRSGCPAETLRSGLGMEEELFAQLLDRLASGDVVTREGHLVRLRRHQVRLDPEEERARAELLRRLDGPAFEPPTFEELVAQGTDPELLRALIERQELVRTAKGLVFSRSRQAWLMEQVGRYIREHGSMEVRDLRDLLGTSRKYAVPLMEHLDEIGFTRRVGDRRVLARSEHPGSQR